MKRTSRRFRSSLGAAIILVVSALQVPGTGQSQNGNGERAAFQPTRTAWGDPDLQGYWLPGGGGMMEAPAGQPFKSTVDPGTNSAFADFFPPNRTARRPPGRRRHDVR